MYIGGSSGVRGGSVMSELRMFYRMLGIAEHIIEPSFYHLLGLERRKCDPESVKAALLAKKIELRQSAPGPEFVEQIMRFEKEHLEPAAQVLCDEVRRAKYDQVLARRWRRMQHETVKRSRLIVDVRKAIAKAVDVQGALSKRGKEALFVELKRLGVEEHNIKAILAKIPSPLFETGENTAINVEFFHDSIGLSVGKGALDENAKTKLYALADRLNIDKDVAGMAIDGALTRDDFVIEEKYLEKPVKEVVDGGNEDGGNAENIQLMDEGIEEQLLDEEVDEALHQSDLAYARMKKQWQEEEEKESNKPGIFIAIVGFILLFVVFYIMFNSGGSDVYELAPEDGAALDVPVIDDERPVDLDDSSTGGGDVAESNRNIYSPVENTTDDIIDDSLPEEVPAVKVVEQVKAVSSNAALTLAGRDFSELSDVDLLSDIVLAFGASCGRSSEMGRRSFAWEPEINKMIKASELAEVIAGRVVVDVSKSGNELMEIASVDEAVYLELEEGIVSKDKHVRYDAIEKLKNVGSDRAVEILLGKLGSGSAGNRQTISRRLRALGQIEKPYIAEELAERLAVSTSPSTAQQICLALSEMTGIAPTERLILKPKNGMLARKAFSEYWIAALEKKSKLENSGKKKTAAESVYDIYLPGKLLGAAAYYCGGMAGELSVIGYTEGVDTDRHEPASLQDDKIRIGADPEAKFADSAARVNLQLQGIVRKMPGSGKYKRKLKKLVVDKELRKYSVMLALQRAAVDVESSGQILEMLVRLSYPDGRFKNELGNIRTKRKADIGKCKNVLEQIRQDSFYNLRLFDILIQESGQATGFSRDSLVYDPAKRAVVSASIKRKVARREQGNRVEKIRQMGLLALGLRSYLAGSLDAAGEYFAKLDGKEDYAGKVFNVVDNVSLKSLKDACEKASAGLHCEDCGGTKFIDCRSCLGVGWDLCTRCRGTGWGDMTIDRGRSRRGGVCAFCEGLSVVKCDECLGKGLVDCESGNHGGVALISESDREEVEKVLEVALYLKGGSVDVYSEGALEVISK